MKNEEVGSISTFSFFILHFTGSLCWRKYVCLTVAGAGVSAASQRRHRISVSKAGQPVPVIWKLRPIVGI